MSHSTPDSECTTVPPPKRTCIFHATFVSTRRRSARLLLRTRILLVPEPAPRRVLLENIKVAKTLDYTDTDASAPPLLRRDDDVHLGAFLPTRELTHLCISVPPLGVANCNPTSALLRPRSSPNRNTKLASTCPNPGRRQPPEPPTLMTDVNIVITSLRRISHSSVLSLAGSAESPTHSRPDLGPEALGSAPIKSQLVSLAPIRNVDTHRACGIMRLEYTNGNSAIDAKRRPCFLV